MFYIRTTRMFLICETKHLSCTEQPLAVILATFMCQCTIFFIWSCAQQCREVSVLFPISAYLFPSSFFPSEWLGSLTCSIFLRCFPTFKRGLYLFFFLFMFLGFCCYRVYLPWRGIDFLRLINYKIFYLFSYFWNIHLTYKHNLNGVCILLSQSRSHLALGKSAWLRLCLCVSDYISPQLHIHVKLTKLWQCRYDQNLQV